MPKSPFLHMKRHGRRYRTLFMSIAVTFAVICLLLMTLSFYRLHVSTAAYQEGHNRSGSAGASDAVIQVKNQLSKYLQLCDLLAADSSIRDLPDHLVGEQTTWMGRAIDVRSKLLSAQANFGDIALQVVMVCYPSEQCIVTSRMIFPESNVDFFLHQYSLPSDFLESLPQDRNALFRSGDGTCWLTRGVFRQGSIYAYLLLGFQPESLLTSFSADDVLELRTAGERIYGSNPDITAEMTDRALAVSSDPQPVSVGKGHYYPAAQTLRAIDTTVLGLINAEGRLSQVRSFRRNGLLQIGFSAVIVLMLAFIFAYQIYLPIQRLLTNAMVVEETASLSHAMETVGDRLRNMSDENERYQLTLEASDYLLQGERLQYILSLPDEKAEAAFQEFLTEHALQGKGFISETPILYMPPSGDRAEYPDLKFSQQDQNGFYSLSYMLLSNTLNEKFNFLLIKINSVYVLLTQSGEPGDMTLVQQAISDYMQYLKEYGIQDVLCAATMPVHSAAEMRRLMDDIPNTMENLKFYQGRTPEESASSRRPFPSLSQMQSLTRLLESGKDAEAMQLLRQLLDQLFSLSTDRRYCVRRVHGLMMIVMTSLEKRDPGISGRWLNDFEERIARADTADELKAVTWQIVEELMTRQNDPPESPAGSALLTDVLSYLDEHYMDHDLSMAVLSAQFHVNESTLSRLFRQEKNMTFLEYLQALRVQKAKELLKTCSVKETAAKVGFWDAQALIRVFKKYEGITPGQYKESVQGSESI